MTVKVKDTTKKITRDEFKNTILSDYRLGC